MGSYLPTYTKKEINKIRKQYEYRLMQIKGVEELKTVGTGEDYCLCVFVSAPIKLTDVSTIVGDIPIEVEYIDQDSNRT
jgi:hypothetical protein